MIVGENARLDRYGIDRIGDRSYGKRPLAVVFPTEAAQVAALMKWANETLTPVTPRGGGSGLAGAAIPREGGIVCSFEKMNSVLEIDTRNMVAVVEPGVVTNDLDEALKPHGLFFAGYPMSEDICFIGGNVAENAGGGRAVKYGTTGTYVLGADVVTPTGTVLHLGGKRLKDVTGYDLLHLMIGSEGTLGLFTRLIIRVIPRPIVRQVAFIAFPDGTSASRCVAELKRFPALSAVEFIDGATARYANAGLPAAKRTALPDRAGAFLLVEFDGYEKAVVTGAYDGATSVVEAMDGTIVDHGSNSAEIERAWTLRKAVPWWVKRNADGHYSVEDVVVPPAEIPALVALADELRITYRVPIAVFGHAGDGNFHVNPMKPKEMTPQEWKPLIDRLLRDLYDQVVRLGGTISGEHGIGRKRTKYLELALSQDEIDAMRTIKNALDPNNVLNPGVLLE